MVTLNKINTALISLIFLDIIFIILHILFMLHYLDDLNFRTSYDGGYGERFQYFKYITAGSILIFLSIKNHSKLLLFWALLAFFLFLDDWIRIHEIVGGKMIGTLILPISKKAYHHGQIVYGIITTAILCAIAWHLWKKSTIEVKSLSLKLFISLAALWFSAIAVDYASSMWLAKAYAAPAVLFEEGGEHIAASFFLWFCLQAIILEFKQSKPP